MQKKISQNNQIKENLVSTLQAIVANDLLQVDFDSEIKNNFFEWNQNLVIDETCVTLPEFMQENSEEFTDFSKSVNCYRACADLAAAYLLFHDKDVKQAQSDFSIEERNFLDEFEKIRVISEIKNFYFGAAKNILQKIENDIFSGSTSLSLILLKEIFAKKTLARTSQVASDLAENLNKKIVQEIKSLAHKTHDQQAFLQAVERVLEMLKEEKDLAEKEQNQKDQQEKLSSTDEKLENDLTNFGQENLDANTSENFSSNEEEEGEQQIEKEQKIAEFKEDDRKGEVTIKLDKSKSEQDRIEFKNPYKVYTTKFDEIVFPQKLVSKNELEILRDQLDLKMSKLDTISKKMTLKLKRKLLSKRDSFLEFDATGGILNRKKLTGLVVDPLTENIWINNKNHEYQNTALTILLDNSGSMRGQPIVMSAMACEIIAGILEKFSIKTEIIGFTTADWKGGKARKLWESSGRIKNPGRLNELRHIVYKHFNQNFKKAKTNLGLMLKEGLLKENIDGEALLFARSRLMQQSEKRKILLVISDGTPVDDSTNSANDSDILSDHLHHVINKIENSRNQSKIEVVAIGIGHSTGEFYRNSIAIKSLEELGDVMIKKIVDLI
ncbi:MAG: hypothetical protein EBS06_01890 [Proteobacteria bacterium]|nr:hypothetical protein [Pseudomonadota bacterium]